MDGQHHGNGQQDGDEPVPSETTAPRRRRRWALAGVGLVTVAAVSTGLALSKAGHDKGPDASADDLPSPRSITRDGVTYDVGLTSPAAAALDPDDPRAVTVYAFAAQNPEQPECSALEPQARVLEETASAVRIATYAYTVPSESDEPVVCAYASSEPGADYRAMTLHLTEPLGERRVIDERSGKDIGRLDADYEPTPTYLPRGYVSRPSDPVLDDFAGFTPEGGFVVYSQFDRDREAYLEIRVRSATAWSESGEVLDRGEVGGQEASVTEDDYERCVSWAPRRGLVAEVCSAGVQLPADELLRVARSVPTP